MASFPVYRLLPTVYCSSQLQRLQVLSKLTAQVGALQRHLHRGLEEAELVARVVALALKNVSINRLFQQQSPQGVGQLDLPSGAGLRRRQLGEDGWRQDVTADDGEIRRRLGGLRLFHHIVDAKKPPMPLVIRHRAAPDDSVARRRLS